METHITLLDTKTGKTVTVEDVVGAFQWAENNWSDDCNRVDYFDDEIQDDCYKEVEARIRENNPEADDGEVAHLTKCTCWGAKRFLVIAPTLIEDDTHSYTLREVNHNYPEELLNKFLPKETK